MEATEAIEDDDVFVLPGEIDPGLEGMAERMGIVLVWRDMGRLKGEYRHGPRVIAISPRCSKTQARCALAHELGHAVYGDDAERGVVSLMQERRATRWAAMTLIDPVQYIYVARAYDEDPWALARELDVTPDIVTAWQSGIADLPHTPPTPPTPTESASAVPVA